MQITSRTILSLEVARKILEYHLGNHGDLLFQSVDLKRRTTQSKDLDILRIRTRGGRTCLSDNFEIHVDHKPDLTLEYEAELKIDLPLTKKFWWEYNGRELKVHTYTLT